jgi:hypothetical protein
MARLMDPVGPSQPRVVIDSARTYEILGVRPVDNVVETIDYLAKLEDSEWAEVGVASHAHGDFLEKDSESSLFDELHLVCKM